MSLSEPHATASLLLAVGLLLGLSALVSRAWARTGVPVFLLFLGIGMFAGSQGFGGIAFENYPLAFRLGTISLVLILFDGGLNTPLSALRRAAAPAGVLATVGVLITAALVAFGAWMLGVDMGLALLLGAVVSSTDAAAVFSVLRGSGVRLKERVAATIELESGLNDPMAMILTTALTASLLAGRGLDPGILWHVPVQLVIGALAGLALGYGGRYLLGHGKLPIGGLYPVLSLAIAGSAFGVATLLKGSGFLAVYVAGILLGNSPRLAYKAGLIRFHDAAAWCGQVGMFLMLGLLVFPMRLLDSVGYGLMLALFMTFFARPMTALLCLLPFRFSWREILLTGWVGLRGSVPIILATVPVMYGVPGADRLFDVVFFVVVAGAFVPGGTVAWASRKLGLVHGDRPPPEAVLEILSTRPLAGDVISFQIDEVLPVCGLAVSDIPFPETASALMIVRGEDLVAPRGNTVLEPDDHLYLFCRPEDRAFIELLFGKPEA